MGNNNGVEPIVEIPLTPLPSTESLVDAAVQVIQNTEKFGGRHGTPGIYPDPVAGWDIGYGTQVVNENGQINSANVQIILNVLQVPAASQAMVTQAIIAATKAGGKSEAAVNAAVNAAVGSFIPGGQFALNQTQAASVLQSVITGTSGTNGTTGISTLLNNLLNANGLSYIAGSSSYEYVALLDLYYAGGTKLVRGNLIGALQGGDRAEAWFQIRYQSNGNKLAGIAKRRYYDAQLFGLFSNPANPSQAEVLSAYQVLTANRATIIQYEAQYGVDPDAPGLASAHNQIAAANSSYGLTGTPQQVQTLTDAFAPAETAIFALLGQDSPLLTALSSQSGFGASVAPTDIFIASASDPAIDASTGDSGVSIPDNPGLSAALTAADLNEAANNHILLGTGNGQTLIGGLGNDILVAGSGSETLTAGLGNDTIVAGADSDTVNLRGADTVDYEFQGQTGLTETIVASFSGVGAIDVGGVQLTGSSIGSVPIVSDGGDVLTWTGLGGTYSYDKATSDLTISTGNSLVGNDSNTIVIENFNLSAAENGGFLGITLGKSAFLNFSANEGVDPPAPDFIAGTTQSYTFSTDGPSDTAQTVTLTLSGVDPADFDVTVTGQTVQNNGDGSFNFTLPAGETNIAYSLTNTADVGASGTLQLTATLSDPSEPTIAAVTSNSLTQNFVEPADDPFSTPQPTLYFDGSEVAGTDTFNLYTSSSVNGGTAVTGATGTDNFIEVGPGTDSSGNPVGIANDSINGGSGNDTIDAVFGYSGSAPSDGGVNVIDGNGGQDAIVSAYDNLNASGQPTVPGSAAVLIYANSQVDLATAIADANTDSATGQQGDLIISATSNATIVGGNGNDLLLDSSETGAVIVAGSGDDTISSGVATFGSLVLSQISFPAVVDAFQPGFSWSSSFANNQIEVNLGGAISFLTPDLTDSDSGQSSTANDTIFGGRGNDVILLSNGNNEVQLGVGDTTVLGGIGDNTIIGGGGNNSIIGGGGNDYIADGGGNSLIVGNGGNNTIIGGSGNDTLFAGDGSINWATTETGNNYVDGGTGNAIIFGSAGDDTLIAGDGNSTVFGGAGNELIDGGTGNDELIGGNGTDTIDADGSGNDVIQTGGGNTTVYGGDGLDTIQGTTGTDVIYAGDGGTAAAPTEILTGSGNSTVYGGDGTDIIQGTSGTDVLYAGDGGTESGPTQVIAGSGDTTVYGGDGVDEIFGGSGTDVLYAGDGGTDADPTVVQAGSGIATIYGGAGAANLIDTQGGGDSIVGGSGDDNLVGTGGDTLVAGSGNDTLTGTGNITYQFNADSGNAYVDATGGTGTLEFSSDIAPSDVSVGTDLSGSGSPELVLQDDNGSITLAGGLAGNDIQTVEFDGVGSTSLAQLIQQADAAGNTSQGTVAGVNGNLIFDTSPGDSVTAGTGQDTISAWGDGDTLVAGSGGTLIYANGSDDQVIGGPGNDVLDALGANTTLTGGIGNELFDVNDPTDVVDPSGFGSDTILSSVSYILPTLVDTLTLTGSANLTATGNSDAANLITGNSGNDTLVAGSGSDTLVSGTGVDLLEGGFGRDTYVINNSADQISAIEGFLDAAQSSVSYVLQAPVASLTLTGSSDLTATDGYGFATITGNAGNDTLIGGSGFDVLVAGSGIDTFEAGSGSSTFVVNNSADVIEGARESSGDEVEASSNYTLVSGVDTLVLTGGDNLAGTGNDDSFNFIAGNSGNDTLTAGAGSDELQAGSGIDTLVAGSGADTLQGQSGDTYELNAGFGSVEIQQESGSGTVQFGAGITAADLQVGPTIGSDGNPALLLQDGNSQVTIDGGLNGAINEFDFADGSQLSLAQLVLQASPVSTTVAGASGNLIFDNTSAASLEGGVGNDTIYGFGANDTIVAGFGNQQLFGENANDLLVGSIGDDSLYAGSGDDTLVAGSGNTELNGGSGTDSYVLTEGGTSIINANASPGTEIVYLPQGLTLSDFASFEDSNGDLIIQSLSGDTTAIVTGFYNASSDNKTWLIASDTDPPQFLAQWAGSQQPQSSNYAQEIDELKQSYEAQLGVTLKDIGEKGGTIENPGATIPADNPPFNYVYQFNGLSEQSVTVTGGSLNVGPTESQQTQSTVLQEPTTQTFSIPVYQQVVTPATVTFIPVGDTPQDQLNLENNDVQTTVVDGVQGEEVFLPGEVHEVVSGFTTVAEVVNPGVIQVNEQEGFSVTNVTGDGGNDVITATAPYVGAISTGDGNVSVNLGGSPSLSFSGGDGDAQLGAFVEAGAGNDTIVGGSGADTIAAGTGFDYLSGALGATYYVPLEGDANDVIADAVTPYGAGEDFPLTTLVLPTGITPQDLQYRVFQDPNTGEPVLQLRYGDSTVLVDFSNHGTFEGPTGNGASAGVNLFQFADGTVLTRDQLIAQATLLPNDFNPVVSANDQFISPGQTVSASTFFSATDNPDNPITWYQVTNTGAGGGYFTLDGQEQSPGQTFYVRTDQLSQLAYVGGSTSGFADSVQVSAFDGAIWSATTTFAVVPENGANSFEATDVNQIWIGDPNSPSVLTGGFAGDTLVGGSGQDTFIYTAGSGPEVISETAAQSSTSDNILQFGSGITPGSITLSEAAGGVLTLAIGGNGDSVSIDGFDPVNPLGSIGIQQFQFSDGTDLSFSQLLAQASGSAGSFENADGTIASYSFSPGESALYCADTFNTDGEITEFYNLNSDGSTSVETFTYDSDGSQTSTTVATSASGAITTTVESFDATGDLLSENITKPNGSTDDSTFSYNADGSYTENKVHTAAGASASTTTIESFDVAGDLLSKDVTKANGSTVNSTFSYNADGSYTETKVHTAAGASASTTTVESFDAAGDLLTENITKANGSTDDSTFSYNADGSLDTQVSVVTDYSTGISTTTTLNNNPNDGINESIINLVSTAVDDPNTILGQATEDTSLVGDNSIAVTGDVAVPLVPLNDAVVTVSSASSVAIPGNGSSVTLGTGDTATVTGTGETISGSNDAVTLGASSSGTITGNSDSVTLGTGDTATVTGTGETISASSDTVTLNGVASLSRSAINGSDDVINVGELSDTDVTGNDEIVNLVAGGNSEVSLNGSGSVVTITASATKSIGITAVVSNGTSDAAPNIVQIEGDAIFAPEDIVSGVGNIIETMAGYSGSAILNDGDTSLVVEGSGTTSVELTSASNTITVMANSGSTVFDGTVLDGGGGNDIQVGADDSTEVTDNNDSVTLGTGDTATVTGTGETISGSNDAVTLGASSSGTITGNSDSVTLGTGDTATVTGTGETISASGDTVTLGASSTGIVTGDSDTVTLGAGASVTLAGNNDTISSSEDLVAATVSGTGDTTNVSNSSVYLNGSGTSDTVDGTADQITLNASGETIFVSGTDNTVYASDDTIYFTGNDTGDSVVGSGNTEVVDTAAGASVATTYNSQGQVVNTNNFVPSANGSYTDTWSTSNGASGEYWWNSSTYEYQETWQNADGSSFTDTYQYAEGGSPGASGYSFTETYSDSSGDTGSRIYNASTGVTTVSWDSAETGAISGTSANDSGFIGLQLESEITNTTNDPTYFNPLVSPAFNAFLTAHG